MAFVVLFPEYQEKQKISRFAALSEDIWRHARIYCFGSGTQEQMYISSADFMTRNTERRVEVACPIYDEKVRAKIHEIIEAQEYDNQKARVLMADGNYVKKSTMQEMVDSQQLLMDYAIQNVSVPITQETKKRRIILGQLLHKWRKNR